MLGWMQDGIRELIATVPLRMVQSLLILVWFEVLTPVVMKSSIFCLPPAFTLVSCTAYSRTLKMEAICSSETSVDTQRTTRRSIPGDRTLQLVECFERKGSACQARSKLSRVRVSGSTYCRWQVEMCLIQATLEDVGSSEWRVSSRGRPFGSIGSAFVPPYLPAYTEQDTDLGLFCSLCLLLDPEDGGSTLLRNFNKRTKLHGVTYQKITRVVVSAVRISNLTVR
jgi:hypothetical protein